MNGTSNRQKHLQRTAVGEKRNDRTCELLRKLPSEITTK